LFARRKIQAVPIIRGIPLCSSDKSHDLQSAILDKAGNAHNPPPLGGFSHSRLERFTFRCKLFLLDKRLPALLFVACIRVNQ